MDDLQLKSVVQNALAELSARSIDTRTIEDTARRRRRRRIASGAAVAVVALTAAAFAFGLHDNQGSGRNLANGPGRSWNPGCGSGGSIDPITGQPGAAEQGGAVVAGKPGVATAISGIVRLNRSVASVTDAKLTIGPPDSKITDASSVAPHQPQGPFDKATTIRDFGEVADGQTLSLSVTLQAGVYPVYGVISYVQTPECGGLAAETWNQVATIKVGS